MDKETIRFIHDHLDSRTKLDVALFFQQNRYALETAAGLARRIGRTEAAVRPELEELVAASVISTRGTAEGGSLYAYTEDGLVAKYLRCVEAAAEGPERDQLLAWVSEGEGRRGNLRLQEIRRVESLQTQFLALISHELRTPLTAIKGYVDLLRSSPAVDAAQRDLFLSAAADECDRLTTTVNNLLLAAELEQEAGWQCLPRAMALSPVVECLVAEMGRRVPSRSFRLSLPVGEPWVLADEVGVALVIRNLLDNAVKFSQEGSTVSVWTEVAGSEVLLHVGDEGIGISAERQRAIFERFYQAEHYRTRRAPGAGLGLYLARRVMEQMNGRIAVRSDLGKGSVFTCAFVRAAAEPREAEPPLAVAAGGVRARGAG
ncbi:MAG: HAMP domain-containing histidine kinase [Armatimonadetes bacterium]|jgi:signal transduction histidine kinase|nr:HAMP domain-containing histidine kinase [Armatimonadota bacterium]